MLDGKIAIAFAGSIGFTHAFREALEKDQLLPKAKNIQEALETMKAVSFTVSLKYFGDGAFSKEEGFFEAIVCGLENVYAGEPRLFRLVQTGISEQVTSSQHYCCIGHASEYAFFLMKLFYSKKISKRAMISLMSDVILQAQRIDATVGGIPQIVIAESNKSPKVLDENETVDLVGNIRKSDLTWIQPKTSELLRESFAEEDRRILDRVRFNLKGTFEKAWIVNESGVSPELARQMLSRIAISTSFSTRGTLPEMFVLEIIRTCLNSAKGIEHRVSEFDIVNLFVKQRVLIGSNGEIGFIHDMVQKYFYEEGIREQIENNIGSKELVQLKVLCSEFENMIKDNSLKEKDYQSFLEKNAWFFGEHYVKAYPQERAGSKLIEDFLLETTSGFHDVVEIKKPCSKIFVGMKGKLKLSSECNAGISRLMDYLDYYERNVQEEHWNTGREIYKPKGILLIGRGYDTDHRKLRQLNSQIRSIEILTYDDLLNRGQRIAELLSRFSKAD